MLARPDPPSRHRFLRAVRLAAVPGPATPLHDDVLRGLAHAFEAHGHSFTTTPDDRTDAFVTTGRWNEPIVWRASPMFVGRKQYRLNTKPSCYTIVHASRAQFDGTVERLTAALATAAPDAGDFTFPGVPPTGWQVLYDQGQRGGSLMTIARLLQSQMKCLRILLVVGDARVEFAHLFDLAGAHPRIEMTTPERFYTEVALRIATQLSTREVTAHRVEGEPIAREYWAAATAPAAMLRFSRELGRRRFFTRMVKIAELVDAPVLKDVLATQYSEGCYGTWDPLLRAQIVTVTGSHHPVEKDELHENDLAVLTGVQQDGSGAVVRHVEGLRNDPPSSEAVEFESIDQRLPRIVPPASFGIGTPAPVVRSKLHGHRGVASYDPRSVEYVPLDAPYFSYLVSCSTEAQAHGITEAFARSQALRDPDDPRTVVFTVLPGHGLLIAEKWVPGTEPFEAMLRAMDEGRLEVAPTVPQGRMTYVPAGDRMELRLVDQVPGGIGTPASGGMPASTQAR